MSGSVKLSEEAKTLLDKAQARVTLATGRKITQQELLEAMIEFSSRREDQLIEETVENIGPLSSDELDQLMSEPTDWGVETREDEIDKTLYGEGCTERTSEAR
jgi:hypothetical protein